MFANVPKHLGRVVSVGRLDFNTEGLLLLTNDGEFKRQMELPSTGIPRTYRARAFGEELRSEDGVGRAVSAIEHHLQPQPA